MNYNLLEESWIPVRRRSGLIEWIRPSQIVSDGSADPFVSFAAPRPDFNAAYAEFMIGLLQTCAAPLDQAEWYTWYKTPPTVDALTQRFSTFAAAFNLIGEGPLFLQDFEQLGRGVREVSALLIDYPGQQTINDNKDHFVKRTPALTLGPAAAAISLFTLQSMAPGGGQGHRTSMRGGGPWITMLRSTSLWTSLWSNVVDLPSFEREYPFMKPADLSDVARIFPWMSPTRTSEKDTGGQVFPTDTSPLQAYWGMPRRIRLLGEERAGRDSLFAADISYSFKAFEMVNYGIDYNQAWRHPLTPYRFDKNQESSSIKGSAAALSFRNWSRYTFAHSTEYDAALVVRVAQERIERWEELANDLVVLACGYDMDNMKARCWYEGQMPLFNVPERHRETFDALCAQLVSAFGEVANTTHECIRRAKFLHYKPGDNGKSSWSRRDLPSSGDQRQRSGVNYSLESSVTSNFYESCHALLTLLGTPHEAEDAVLVKETWLKTLERQAFVLFDRHVAPASGAADYPAIARARFELAQFASHRNKKLRATLGLPSIT